LALAIGCADGTGEPDEDSEVEEAIDPLDFDPTALGPWGAGFRAWELTYTLPGGEERTVLLNLWYPTEASTGEEVVYSGRQPDLLALGEAAPASSAYASGYPVMAYSHGDQAWGGSSADLMRWFASHGWVAVAPDHTGNLLFANVDPTPSAHWLHRPQDVSAVLDALEVLPQGDPLAGMINTSEVVLSGHSRGTYTVWAAGGASFDATELNGSCADCTEEQRAQFLGGLGDPRIKALLPLAGTIRRSWFGAEGHRSVQGPVLAMTGTNDGVGQQEQWDGMDGVDFTWIDLEGGCHQTFALGACDTLDPARGFRIVDSYALAFARYHLLDDRGAQVVGLVEGTTELDEAVSWQRKQP
jgi:predicted dienelactone hydrolase